MPEPLNIVFLLSIGMNKLADASRSLCAKVSVPGQRVNGAAGCGRMECSCHLVRMKEKVIDGPCHDADIIHVFSVRCMTEISSDTQQACAWCKYTHFCPLSIHPPPSVFYTRLCLVSLLFLPTVLLPLPSSSEAETQLASRDTKTSPVVTATSCSPHEVAHSLFLDVPHSRQSSNGLTGRLVPRLGDISDSVVLGGTAQRTPRHCSGLCVLTHE